MLEMNMEGITQIFEPFTETSTSASLKEDVLGFYDLFSKTYYPILAIIGSVGNIFNIIIMSSKVMRKYSSSFYLLGLAFADIFSLIFYTFKYSVYKAWAVTEPYPFHVYLCVYNNWLLVGANRVTFFITIAFTIERFIAVAFPLKYKVLCSVRKTQICIGMLFVSGIAYGAYNLAIRTVDENNKCVFKGSNVLNRAVSAMNAVVILLTYTILAVFNGLIIYHMCVQTKMRNQQFAHSVNRASGTNTENGSSRLPLFRKYSHQIKVTITLLTVSFTFMMLWFPWLIVYTRDQLPNNITGAASEDTLQVVAEIMGPLNSAVNFFLYNVTSVRYRNLFVSLILHCDRKGSSSENTSHSASLHRISSIGSELNTYATRCNSLV